MAKKTKMEKIYELQTYLRKRAKSNPVFGTGIEVKWKDRGVLRAGEVRGEIYYKGARMELIQNKSASSLDCNFVGYHMLGFEEIKLTPDDTRLLEKIFFWGPTCTPGEFKKMVEKEGMFDKTSPVFEMVLNFWYDMVWGKTQRLAAGQENVETMKATRAKATRAKATPYFARPVAVKSEKTK